MKRNRRKRNEDLKRNVGGRIKILMGDMSGAEFSRTLDSIIGDRAPWAYTNGLSLPDPEVLLKIAEKYNVTLDWLLKGETSGTTTPFSSETIMLAREIDERLKVLPAKLNMAQRLLDVIRAMTMIYTPEQIEEYGKIMEEREKKHGGRVTPEEIVKLKEMDLQVIDFIPKGKPLQG